MASHQVFELRSELELGHYNFLVELTGELRLNEM